MTQTTPSAHAIAQRVLNGGKEPETISIEEHNRLIEAQLTKKPTPRQMIEWLESYFDCDDMHNNCPEPKWAIHIRDFIKEHGHVS